LGDGFGPFERRSPTKIRLYKRRGDLRVALVYENESRLRDDGIIEASFPDEWGRIVAIDYGDERIYNKRSALSNGNSSEALRRFGALRAKHELPRNARSRIVKSAMALLPYVGQTDAEIASAFILGFLEDLDAEDWNLLRSNDNQNWQAMFQVLGLRTDQDFVLFWRVPDTDDFDEGRLLRLSIDGATNFPGRAMPGEHPGLPVPTEQWWLHGTDKVSRSKS